VGKRTEQGLGAKVKFRPCPIKKKREKKKQNAKKDSKKMLRKILGVEGEQKGEGGPTFKHRSWS